MPFHTRHEYFEFPKRMELPVLKELPQEFEVRAFLHSFEAWTKIDVIKKDKLRFMTLCKACGGWVEGQAHQHQVNDLDGSRLCGRKGVEFYCPRCAKQIHFEGVMS